MQRDFALSLSVVALCAVTVVGSLFYKHATDNSIHCDPNGNCVCPCDPQPAPRKPGPFRPRRPDGSTGDSKEVGKIDGVKPRDM